MIKEKIVSGGEPAWWGMSYAYALLNQNLCDELVLIDIDKKRAEGEAMDLNHGVAFSGGNMEIYAGQYKDCGDADLVVLTAGLPQKEGAEPSGSAERKPEGISVHSGTCA